MNEGLFSLIRIIFAPSDSHSGTKQLIHPGDENGGGVVIEIASITIHPKYQPFTFENDIALIRLKEVDSKLPNVFMVNFISGLL